MLPYLFALWIGKFVNSFCRLLKLDVAHRKVRIRQTWTLAVAVCPRSQRLILRWACQYTQQRRISANTSISFSVSNFCKLFTAPNKFMWPLEATARTGFQRRRCTPFYSERLKDSDAEQPWRSHPAGSIDREPQYRPARSVVTTASA